VTGDALAMLFPNVAVTRGIAVRVAVSYLAEQSDPSANRWSTLAQAPMGPRVGSQVVWTGRKLAVLLGIIPAAKGSSSGATYVKDGAVFTPAGF
jgi:hypothetical protein